jgi:hypothetical protein
MLKSGADAHDFTREERAKGGRARAEKVRERREGAQAFADEKLQAVLGEALHELEELLHSDDPRVKLKAAVVILDRTLGRPSGSNTGARSTSGGPTSWRRPRRSYTTSTTRRRPRPARSSSNCSNAARRRTENREPQLAGARTGVGNRWRLP